MSQFAELSACQMPFRFERPSVARWPWADRPRTVPPSIPSRSAITTTYHKRTLRCPMKRSSNRLHDHASDSLPFHAVSRSHVINKNNHDGTKGHEAALSENTWRSLASCPLVDLGFRRLALLGRR